MLNFTYFYLFTAELTSNLDTELPHHLSMNPQNQVACLQETESKLALEVLIFNAAVE